MDWLAAGIDSARAEMEIIAHAPNELLSIALILRCTAALDGCTMNELLVYLIGSQSWRLKNPTFFLVMIIITLCL